MNNTIMCKKCHTEINDNCDFCSVCGEPTSKLNLDDFNNGVFEKSKTTETIADDVKNVLSSKDNKLKKYMKICLITSALLFCLGFYKNNVYKNPEYSWETSINAHVGGDAYNYIINGNRATGCYVLSMGFMLAGTMCGCTNAIIDSKKED